MRSRIMLKRWVVMILAGAGVAQGAETLPGKAIFATYCAACHGANGAGLVGPNLTDRIFLHGGTQADIRRTITDGVADKGMPAWSAVLPPADLQAVTEFTCSLIGRNLAGPKIKVAPSQVTPFPQGTAQVPLLMRTFMPTLGLDPAVFAHHGHGLPVTRYDPAMGGDVEGTDLPIAGVPSVIAVNFGNTLSYAFDTTECRLLYIWSGRFMDMTRYWGSAAGGSRKKNDYVPVVLGPVWWRAAGAESVRMPKSAGSPPRFLGYDKRQQVPVLRWRQDSVAFNLLITPGTTPGTAICRYTTTGADNGLELVLSGDDPARLRMDRGTSSGATWVLSAGEAAEFTLTITPGTEPVVPPPGDDPVSEGKAPAKGGGE